MGLILIIYLCDLVSVFQESGTREFVADDEFEESDLSDFEVIFYS